MFLLNHLAFIGRQLSIGLGFLFHWSLAIYVYHLLCFCAHSNYMYAYDAQKGHKHNQRLRVNYLYIVG